MTLKNKRILITGAAGFIGSHLAEKLLNEEAEITCLVKNKNNTGKLSLIEKDLLNKIKFIEGNIKDENFNFSPNNFDFVFHLAASISIQDAIKNTKETFENNIFGTLNLLNHFKNFNGKLIYIGSLGIYGNPSNFPTSEEEKPKPLEPYTISKLSGELLVQYFSRNFKLKHVIARIFNCYGDRQSKTSLIPIMINNILQEKEIKLSNFKTTRDFIYVKDVVNALILLAEKGEGIYNIGTGVETSLLELTNNICEIIGRKVNIIEDNFGIKPNMVEVYRSQANIKKIKSIGWQPQWKLKEGLKLTVDYYRKFQ